MKVNFTLLIFSFLLCWSAVHAQVGLQSMFGTDIKATDGNTGYGLFGNTDSHISIDTDDIQRFTSAGPNTLFFNFYGGNMILGNAGLDSEAKVGILQTNPTATLHIKQAAAHEEGIAIENNGEGNDVWAWEVGTDDLILNRDGVPKAQWQAIDGDILSLSDISLKSNIQDLEAGTLQKVLQLRPTSYLLEYDSLGSRQPSMGLIAQEVEKVFPELVSKVETGEEDELLGVSYRKLTILLLKAFQEQHANFKETETENARLQSEVHALKSQLTQLENFDNILKKADELEARLQAVAEMEERLYRMESSLQSCCMQATTSNVQMETSLTLDKTKISGVFPKLEQNQPNPFNAETSIQYYLPTSVERAQLVITDINGQILKTFFLQDAGFGRVLIGANELPAGNLTYSLLIDGKVVQSKKMVISQ